MKTSSIFFSLALLLVLFTSCSRQLTSLSSTDQLKAVSVLEKKPERIQPQNFYPSAQTDAPVALTVTPETTNQNCVDDSKPSPVLRHGAKTGQLLKNEANSVRLLVYKQLNDLTLSQKHVADRGYPQINKAGFIFVAAGILGFLLKLIPIACIILIAIGLIVLLSPLLHKRY